MKKGIFLAVMILGIMTVSSVKAQLTVGPGVWYATDIENIGVQGVAHYDLPSNFGIMAGYTYFFQKKKAGHNVNNSAIDVDATYDFYKMGDRGGLYGLAGVSFLHFKAKTTPEIKDNGTGFNLGVGWKIGMKVGDLVPEVRYTFGGGSGTYGSSDFLRVGVKLMFGVMKKKS